MKTNYLIFNALRYPLRIYFKLFWDLEVDRAKIKHIKKPFILLANHVTNYDPILINIYLNNPLYYVTSDAQFRRPIIKTLLSLVHAIPKTKAKSDLKTVRDIIRILGNDECVGIFPEGQRSWDGNTVKLIESTASLIKLAKCPIVICKITGGYLSIPRWAKWRRKGPVKLTYELLFNGPELNHLSKEMIKEKLTQALANSDLNNQEHDMQHYVGKRLAEYIERVLYICPVCGSEFSIVSHGDSFRCRFCHTQSKYDEQGFINFGGFKRLDQWTDFQKEKVREYFNKKRKLFYAKSNIRLSIGSRMKRLKYYSQGNLQLTRRYIAFKSSHEELKFPIDKINGENVQRSYLLEFYYDDRLYQIDFNNTRYSAYAWLHGIRYFKKMGRLNQWQIDG